MEQRSASNPTSPPAPAYAGGTKAITQTPVVGTPRRTYAEMYVPGEEKLEDGELRVTVLGSGNPWNTRAQASASILVEAGNAEHDLITSFPVVHALSGAVGYRLDFAGLSFAFSGGASA
jgi:ribonuclease Z